jgi:hypothetical protein
MEYKYICAIVLIQLVFCVFLVCCNHIQYSVGEEVTKEDLEAVDKSVDGQSLLKIQPINQIKAVARGLVAIVPPQLLWILNWSELEMLICGTPREMGGYACIHYERYNATCIISCKRGWLLRAN